MQALAQQLRPRWPIVALLVSGALLAGAHAFETFGHLQPCAMCLAQREWHWGVLGVAALAIILVRGPVAARWVACALGLAFLGSFAMAAWHVAVEHHWIAAQCEVGGLGDLTFNVNAELHAPSCDQIAWSMFGITMAGYNAIISLALALASFFVAFAPEKQT